MRSRSVGDARTSVVNMSIGPSALSAGGLSDVQSSALAFKALGDPVRLQLLALIASHPAGEVCVCDLMPSFEVTGPTISHHLRVLRESGLVVSDRRGTWVYYRVVPERLSHLSEMLAIKIPATTQAPPLDASPPRETSKVGVSRSRVQIPVSTSIE